MAKGRDILGCAKALGGVFQPWELEERTGLQSVSTRISHLVDDGQIHQIARGLYALDGFEDRSMRVLGALLSPGNRDTGKVTVIGLRLAAELFGVATGTGAITNVHVFVNAAKTKLSGERPAAKSDDPDRIPTISHIRMPATVFQGSMADKEFVTVADIAKGYSSLEDALLSAFGEERSRTLWMTTPARTVVDLYRYAADAKRRPGLADKNLAREVLVNTLRAGLATPAEIERCARRFLRGMEHVAEAAQIALGPNR
jgi:hypothetical protein